MNRVYLGNKYRDNLTKFVAVLLTIATITLMTGAVSDKQRKKIILVSANAFNGTESSKNYITKATTVNDFLKENNIAIDDDEVLEASIEDELTNNQRIVISKALPIEVNENGSISKVMATRKTVGTALENAGIKLDILDRTEPTADSIITDGMKIKIFRVAVKKEYVEEALPFGRTEIQDSTLEKGTTAVKEIGVEGIKRTAYNVMTENGKEIQRDFVSSEVIKEPVNEVVLVGTKEPAKITVNGKELNYKKKITVTATAYTATGNRTASGRAAQVGVIAVDPKVIPLGTKLYVESVDEGGSWTYGYCIAGDTGGAIKGNKIDLYYDTKGECIKFGRRSATVYVLD